MGIMDYLFAGDPQSLQPSTTGRDAVTPAHLSMMPQGKGAEDRYLTLMQYLTQPKRDAGPANRRAEAGMPVEHGNTDEPSPMQQSPVMMQLMARLFGGR